jgi:hypothetical protein
MNFRLQRDINRFRLKGVIAKGLLVLAEYEIYCSFSRFTKYGLGWTKVLNIFAVLWVADFCRI